VFAGYLKPGLHQIIVYDQQDDTFWAKNLVVDVRSVDPVLPVGELKTAKSHIK
jgi:hypothetical protein